MGSSSRHSYVALDALRGMAALLVVLGHARLRLFDAADLPVTGSGAGRLLLVPTSFGIEAVAIFFALSGYLVGGQVLRLHSTGTFSWGSYLSRRGTRLAIVLIPGLVVTWLLDLATGRVSRTFLDEVVLPDGQTARTFACNALFLQESRCVPYGSNSSLWSLSYELWFYVLFAGAVALLWPRQGARARVLGAVAAVVALVIFGPQLLVLIPSWLMGAAVAWWISRRGDVRPTWEVPLLVVLALVGVAGLVGSQAGLAKAVSYPLIGAGVCALLVVIVDRGPGWSPWWLREPGRLGPWSYSLYVFHLPVITLLAVPVSVLVGRNAVLDVVAILLVTIIAATASWAISLITERRTDALRGLVSARVSRRPEATAAD